MTEAQIQLQNALTTTFLANLAFLSEYDNELYHRVDELSRMIERGEYKEKYALEFNMNDGDFDIYDILNDKYLYNKNPKKFNNDLIRKSEQYENNYIQSDRIHTSLLFLPLEEQTLLFFLTLYYKSSSFLLSLFSFSTHRIYFIIDSKRL